MAPTTRFWAPIALALAGTLLFAAAAEAGKGSLTVNRGVVTRAATATASGNRSILTATATCPKKTRAVGGGFLLPTPSGFLPLIYESLKVGQRAWRASAQILDPTAPADTVTLAVSAYCRRGVSKTSTVTSTVATTGAAPQVGPATSASCPSNRRLLGGGFATPPPGDPPKTLTIRSEPTGNSWTSAVISASGASTLSSYAYCARKRAIVGSLPVAATTPGATTPPTRSTTTATCAGQRTITGGGFSQNAMIGAGGSYYLVLEAGRSGKSWIASGAQVGPSTTASFTSAGLCSPKRLAR